MSASDASSGLELQPRDLNLLRDLFVSRLMTLAQAGAIHFAGKQEMAKKRVHKLKSAGMIAERARKAYEPSILFLTRVGFDVIREQGVLHDLPQLAWSAVEQRLQVSELTLRHELDVMDVKAAFFTAAREDSSLSIAAFTTWPMLCQFTTSLRNGDDMMVKPDGFVRLHQHIGAEVFEHVFYLELDRSTESLDTLVRKAQAYLSYYQSGGLAERFGRPRSEYKDFPFRVLMVFKSAERRNNVAERLLAGSPPILTHTWLATIDEVLAGLLGSVWVRPRDYRDAVADTSIAPRLTAVYRRDLDRNRHVEERLQKQSLFSKETVESQPT